MNTIKIMQSLSNPEIISEFGRRFKEYRLSCKLTQKETAERAGVSTVTLSQFESGKATNISLGCFLALLRVIGCVEQMDNLLPEIPISAYEMEKIIKKRPKRIKHG